MKTTIISLKRLTEKYTTAEIFHAASEKFTFFSQDTLSLLDLISKIRKSSDVESNGMDIVPMVALFKKGEYPSLISYGGFQKNSRNYKFTAKNCSNIEKISCCNVQMIEHQEVSDISFISEYLAQTELELLIVILLSINAFNPKIVDCYFDGDSKVANSIDYIMELIRNNASPVNDI